MIIDGIKIRRFQISAGSIFENHALSNYRVREKVWTDANTTWYADTH